MEEGQEETLISGSAADRERDLETRGHTSGSTQVQFLSPFLSMVPS